MTLKELLKTINEEDEESSLLEENLDMEILLMLQKIKSFSHEILLYKAGEFLSLKSQKKT